MGFLDKKGSQWERINQNVDNETGFLGRIGNHEEGNEKKRKSFLGRRDGGRE